MVATAGVDRDTLTALLAAVRRAGKVAVMAGTGITMSRAGIVTEWLRWALLIVTGSLDREGGMRCNPGYLFPAEGHRFPAPPEGAAAARPSGGPASRADLGRWMGQFPCAGMADEIAAGELRALVIVGGNPLTAFPDAPRTRAALASLDVLAVVDVIHSDLTAIATHVLPVAGQLERADLPMLEQYAFGNGIQYTDAVVAPGARRRPTWWVMAQLGRRLGLDVLGGGLDPDACDDATLLARLAATSRGGADAIRAAGPRGIVMPSVYGWVHDALADGRWRVAPEPLVEQLAALAGGPAPARARRVDPPPRDARDELGTLRVRRRSPYRPAAPAREPGRRARGPASPTARARPGDERPRIGRRRHPGRRPPPRWRGLGHARLAQPQRRRA